MFPDRRPASLGPRAKIACARLDAMPSLWTIGYERLWPEQLVAELEAAGVERVIDVRFRPQSRRPGMSKTKLSERLAAHGIAYEHRRQLGTPPEIRVHFKAGRLRSARALFRRHLDEHASAEIDALAAELDDGPRTALLCLEEDPRHCHRSVIVTALRERRSDLEVTDL
jgi:uncharacterized protein (DUF488 family)